jgi:hypothetical protein
MKTNACSSVIWAYVPGAFNASAIASDMAPEICLIPFIAFEILVKVRLLLKYREREVGMASRNPDAKLVVTVVLCNTFMFADKPVYDVVRGSPQKDIDKKQGVDVEVARQEYVERAEKHCADHNRNHCGLLRHAYGKQFVMDVAFVGQERVAVMDEPECKHPYNVEARDDQR